MRSVANLGKIRKNKRLQGVVLRLGELEKSAQEEFEALRRTDPLLGVWPDNVWRYQNGSIYFTKPVDVNGNLITGKSKKSDREPVNGVWAIIMRLWALKGLKMGKNRKSIAAEIGALSWLADSLSYSNESLINFNQSTLDATIPLLESKFQRRGPFERYKTMVSIAKNLLIPFKIVPRFNPKVNMNNPSREQTDVTTSEYENRRDRKYEQDIDRYLGLVKAKFDNLKLQLTNGEICSNPEPKEGYDEIRLLAVPFLMAFGLRIGELCRLTEDCLQYDEINEKYYLKVLTEKGELPSPRPVPRMWEDVILKSYKRLLELTEEHRLFAKSVELNGPLAFIDALKMESRPVQMVKALEEQGFNPDLFLLRCEFGPNGDEQHSSGVTYGRLRSGFKTAEVSQIRYKSPSGRRALHTVYSKKEIASIAFQKYQTYRQKVYQENHLDENESGSYSSSSFSASVSFSQLLFIVKDETFKSQSSGHGFIPHPMTPKSFTSWITNDKTSRNKTVFERYDIRDRDGNVVSLKTHKFRHWLTTALKRSGKNEMMIDLFMGRTPGQGRHYDHRTSKERAETIRERYLSQTPPDDALGRRIKRMRDNNVPEGEIDWVLNHTMSVIHYTPWGTCKRDLDVSPCEKGMMCLRGDTGEGCEHFGIDPDDLEAKQNILNTKTHYENQLAALIPNYRELTEKLNTEEPLDQHIKFCIDTVKGCENALKSYENWNGKKNQRIDVVQVYDPEAM